jgi:hypothetical protein
MKPKSSNKTFESTKNPVNTEAEWVVADDGESSAEPRIEREHVDEHQLDVVQHAPDEPAWTPVEPAAASDGASADDGSAATPKRTQRKPRAQVVTKAHETTEALEGDTATAVEPSAERAARTEPVAKRKPSARTKKDSPSTPSPEPSPPTPAAANVMSNDGVAPVAKKKRRKAAREAPQQTPPVVESEPPPPSEVTAVAPADPATEPVSTLPSMEQYISELSTMSVAQLAKRHVEILGKAPRIKNRIWLQRKLAWFEQTKRYGGLSTAAKKRLDELMGEIELPVPTLRTPKAEAPATRRADDLPLGTRLERKWRDRVIVATRVEGGWSCEGAIYRTLSAAAKEVTQSHVSGPAFFGLWKPKSGGAR